MGNFVGGDPRDVQPKGCDVTVLNYVRRRHTGERVPNTWKPVYVPMIDWVCAIHRAAANGDKTAYAKSPVHTSDAVEPPTVGGSSASEVWTGLYCGSVDYLALYFF